MALFRRNSTPTELPEQAQVEYQDTNAHRWPTLIAYIILALLVATLVVLGGRWVYHKVNDNNSPTTSTTQGTDKGVASDSSSSDSNKTTTNPNPTSPTPSSSSSSNNSGNSSSTGKSTAPSPTPTPTSPSPTTPQSSSSSSKGSTNGKSTTTPTPSSLPNNGPGQVIALFLGSSLLATTFYRFVLTRKSAN